MVNAQEWLNKYYKKSTENIIYPNRINEENFAEFLKSEELTIDNYPQLREITIIPKERKNSSSFSYSSLLSGNRDKEVSIKKIIISNCPQLTKIVIKKINCQELILQNIPHLQHLDISGNKIKEIDLSKQRKLIQLNTEDNPLNKPLFSFFLDKNEKEENYSIGTGTRNILLVGRTGSGKSSLANVICGENKFEESNSIISKTTQMEKWEFEIEINSKYFENEKIKYKVIDSMGFGDTRFDYHDVLKEMKNTCEEVKGGLNQILFLTRGRFTEEEWETYQVLKNVVFNDNIGKYTTIIKTEFADFENEDKCKEEMEIMKNENSNFAQLLEECSNKLIFVNNPSLEISGSGKRAERQNALNKELREASREKLLKHLILGFVNYRPSNLDKISERINNYKIKKEKLEKEKERLEKELVKNKQEKEQDKTKIRELEAKVEQQAKELHAKICIIS